MSTLTIGTKGEILRRRSAQSEIESVRQEGDGDGCFGAGRLGEDDLNTCQNPRMKPDLCPHILLPLDEQACAAINQMQHGRHILLSLGQARLQPPSPGDTVLHSAFYL